MSPGIATFLSSTALCSRRTGPGTNVRTERIVKFRSHAVFDWALQWARQKGPATRLRHARYVGGTGTATPPWTVPRSIWESCTRPQVGLAEDTDWGQHEGAQVDPDSHVTRFGSP